MLHSFCRFFVGKESHVIPYHTKPYVEGDTYIGSNRNHASIMFNFFDHAGFNKISVGQPAGSKKLNNNRAIG